MSRATPSAIGCCAGLVHLARLVVEQWNPLVEVVKDVVREARVVDRGDRHDGAPDDERANELVDRRDRIERGGHKQEDEHEAQEEGERLERLRLRRARIELAEVQDLGREDDPGEEDERIGLPAGGQVRPAYDQADQPGEDEQDQERPVRLQVERQIDRE